jgi:hypothetical protein
MRDIADMVPRGRQALTKEPRRSGALSRHVLYDAFDGVVLVGVLLVLDWSSCVLDLVVVVELAGLSPLKPYAFPRG